MVNERPPIEYELIQQATLLELEILDVEIEPTVGNENWRVRLRLRADEELIGTCGFGLIYTLGMQSFHDARPRGVSGQWFDADDEWNVVDMLRHLEFRRGQLCFYADYVRGRCLKTTIEVSSAGNVLVETVNRGQAVTRWVDRLRGKKVLAAVSASE
jgi:hypothetical protein